MLYINIKKNNFACWKISSVPKLKSWHSGQLLIYSPQLVISIISDQNLLKSQHFIHWKRHTFARCSLTKLRLWRICSLDVIICWSSVRLCRNSSNDCAVQDFTAVSLLVVEDWCVMVASDSELAISKLSGVNGNPSDDKVLLSFSLFSCDLSWDNAVSLLIPVAPELWLLTRQGRFGVILEVPYRLQRLTRWLRLWFVYINI